jgi:hypothetical protein
MAPKKKITAAERLKIQEKKEKVARTQLPNEDITLFGLNKYSTSAPVVRKMQSIQTQADQEKKLMVTAAAAPVVKKLPFKALKPKTGAQLESANLEEERLRAFLTGIQGQDPTTQNYKQKVKAFAGSNQGTWIRRDFFKLFSNLPDVLINPFIADYLDQTVHKGLPYIEKFFSSSEVQAEIKARDADDEAKAEEEDVMEYEDDEGFDMEDEDEDEDGAPQRVEDGEEEDDFDEVEFAREIEDSMDRALTTKDDYQDNVSQGRKLMAMTPSARIVELDNLIFVKKAESVAREIKQLAELHGKEVDPAELRGVQPILQQPEVLAGVIETLSEKDRNTILDELPTESSGREYALSLQSMSSDERGIEMAAMTSEARAAVRASEQALKLASLSVEERANAVAKLSPEKRTEVLAAMTPKERVTTILWENAPALWVQNRNILQQKPDLDKLEEIRRLEKEIDTEQRALMKNFSESDRVEVKKIFSQMAALGNDWTSTIANYEKTFGHKPTASNLRSDEQATTDPDKLEFIRKTRQILEHADAGSIFVRYEETSGHKPTKENIIADEQTMIQKSIQGEEQAAYIMNVYQSRLTGATSDIERQSIERDMKQEQIRQQSEADVVKNWEVLIRDTKQALKNRKTSMATLNELEEQLNKYTGFNARQNALQKKRRRLFALRSQTKIRRLANMSPIGGSAGEYQSAPWLTVLRDGKELPAKVSNVFIRGRNQSDISGYVREDNAFTDNAGTNWAIPGKRFFDLMCVPKKIQEGDILTAFDQNGSPISVSILYQTNMGDQIQDERVYAAERVYFGNRRTKQSVGIEKIFDQSVTMETRQLGTLTLSKVMSDFSNEGIKARGNDRSRISKDEFARSVVHELAPRLETVTVRKFATELGGIVIALEPRGSQVMRSKVAKGYYSSIALARLPIEERFPEIFEDDAGEETKINFLAWYTTRLDMFVQNFAKNIYEQQSGEHSTVDIDNDDENVFRVPRRKEEELPAEPTKPVVEIIQPSEPEVKYPADGLIQRIQESIEKMRRTYEDDKRRAETPPEPEQTPESDETPEQTPESDVDSEPRSPGHDPSSSIGDTCRFCHADIKEGDTDKKKFKTVIWKVGGSKNEFEIAQFCCRYCAEDEEDWPKYHRPGTDTGKSKHDKERSAKAAEKAEKAAYNKTHTDDEKDEKKE